MLKEKLREEVEEFIVDETIEEVADVAEVLEAIAVHKKFAAAEVTKVRKRKADERGRFEAGIILDEA